MNAHISLCAFFILCSPCLYIAHERVIDRLANIKAGESECLTHFWQQLDPNLHGVILSAFSSPVAAQWPFEAVRPVAPRKVALRGPVARKRPFEGSWPSESGPLKVAL